jgi:hypothetical protein
VRAVALWWSASLCATLASCVSPSLEGLSPVDCLTPADCADGRACVAGRCADPQSETCDGADQDGDGRADEGFELATDEENCGACGAACDGICLEGVCRDPDDAAPPCAQSGDPIGVEVCDAVDQDCDGVTDEGTLNACGTCGEAPAEACDGVDQDCDGVTDEDTLNACGACGEVPPEQPCTRADEDCDAQTDENDPPEGCAVVVTPESACDGLDDDADTRVDEGLLNRCGVCGPLDAEVCDGTDQDCDGAIDESPVGLGEPCAAGVGGCERNGAQVCGIDEAGLTRLACDAVAGTPADERCGDALDNDCDGRSDEGFEADLGVECSAGIGECAQSGETVCLGDGTIVCGATPVAPSAEACNSFFDDDCDGAVDEGFDLSIDADNCGVCGVRCAGPNALGRCVDGQCFSDGCRAPFVDLDGAAANGCECDTTAPDLVDPRGVDSNCDGVDGDAARTIMVSAADGVDCLVPDGFGQCLNIPNPDVEGTSASPVQTLARALTLAAIRGSDTVLVEDGVYEQAATLRLDQPLGLHGGYSYDRATGRWSRPGVGALATRIRGRRGLNAPVVAVGRNVDVILEAVTLEAPSADAGFSAIALAADNCTSLTVSDARIAAASGGAGLPPPVPDPGPPPSEAMAGGVGDTDFGLGGRGGENPACPLGSSGGNGGSGGRIGTFAQPGEASPSGASGGDAADPQNPATNGADGLLGSVGFAGITAPVGGRVSLGAAAQWLPGVGELGTAGAPGGGGGGGGGGQSGSPRPGPGGGGGGAGGCGGLPGLAGGSGGASIAALVVGECRVELIRSTLTSGSGGAGMAGTTGSRGARGLDGGLAGDDPGADQPGGPGGRGGSGGCGGTGPGGNGGLSAALLRVGGAPAPRVDAESDLTSGGSGLGAAPTISRCGADDGPAGRDGVSSPQLCCPSAANCGDDLRCVD